MKSVWLPMAVLWGGYSMLFYGYCLIKGYNIGFLEIVSPVNYYKGGWPPPLFTDTGVIPKGQGANAANPAGGAVQSGAPQPGVQGTVAGGHGR